MAYRKRKFSRKYRRPRRRYSRKRGLRVKRVAKMVRRMIMRKEETKFYSAQFENSQLYHDVTQVAIFDPWQSIVRGTLRNQRVGEHINTIGMKIKFWIANKLDRPNLMYRIIIGFFPRVINNIVLTASNASQFLYKQVDLYGGANPILLDKNTDNKVKWIYDKILKAEKGTSGTAAGVNKECHYYKRMWINMKMRDLSYAGAVSPQGYVPIVFIEAYDSFGTSITDNVASYACQYYLYYKDA